jgi:hypothetical protein
MMKEMNLGTSIFISKIDNLFFNYGPQEGILGTFFIFITNGKISTGQKICRKVFY